MSVSIAHVAELPTFTIARTDDFELDGAGAAKQWDATQWHSLTPIQDDAAYLTHVKTLYSGRGIYCLFECEDRKLTVTKQEDFAPLFFEDVVEVFLWPDESYPLYLEYELSPLGAELPILIANASGGRLMPWRPWGFDDSRKTRRQTAARGGEKEPGAAVEGWTAEFFIPSAMLHGLRNGRLRSGVRWRGNFYRIDHDTGQPRHWAWSPAVRSNFHDFPSFGTLIFE